MVTRNKKSRENVFWIRRQEHWALFESPVRIELLSYLEMLGACSVAQLAQCMERQPDSLYHHIRKLLDAKILKQHGWRKVGRQTEAIYQLVAPVRFDYDPKTGRNAASFQRLASAILRNADRDFKAATDRNNVVMDGTHKNLWIRQETACLSKKALSKVNHHLREIMKILKDSRTAKRGQLHSWTTVLTPLSRSGAADKPARQRKTNGSQL